MLVVGSGITGALQMSFSVSVLQKILGDVIGKNGVRP
jgi:hypothetical protein